MFIHLCRFTYKPTIRRKNVQQIYACIESTKKYFYVQSFIYKRNKETFYRGNKFLVIIIYTVSHIFFTSRVINICLYVHLLDLNYNKHTKLPRITLKNSNYGLTQFLEEVHWFLITRNFFVILIWGFIKKYQQVCLDICIYIHIWLLSPLLWIQEEWEAEIW